MLWTKCYCLLHYMAQPYCTHMLSFLRLILFRRVYNCVSSYLSASTRVKKLKGSKLAGPAWLAVS